MTLTWNLDYYCNLTRETRERQKNGQRCRVNKLWRHHNFPDLWLLWSNPEAGFVTNGLYFLKQQPFILNTYLEHSSHTNGLSKGTTFAKKCWFLHKKKKRFWHWSLFKLFSRASHMCVLSGPDIKFEYQLECCMQ